MKQVIVITGASTGFGALAARALVQAGHTVYATMRETTGRNAPQVAEAEHYAAEHGVDLRTVELDVAAAESVEAGIAKLIADTGRLDVVIHNAGHMSFGPAEAFTPEQFAELFDVNVLSIMKIIGFENSSAVDANWIAAYGAPFPTKDDCIGAIEFPLEVLLGRFLPYVQEGFPGSTISRRRPRCSRSA